jgi:hypothetical protein
MAYNPSNTQQAWDNHFEAFGTQNVTQIMWDYTETSLVQVYNFADETHSTYTGLTEIQGMFEGLFLDLYNYSSLVAPVVEVVDGTADDAGLVFLVWECPQVGYYQASDTFIFDNTTITYQNIVINATSIPASNKAAYTPANYTAAWDNHFEAFGAQNVTQIMLDYNEMSVVRVYDFVAGTYSEFTGLSDIETMFTDLFGTLWSYETLDAPVVDLQPNMVFLVWECPGVGYRWASDTFAFDPVTYEITYQNIVINYDPIDEPTNPNTTTTNTTSSATSASVAALAAAFALLA